MAPLCLVVPLTNPIGFGASDFVELALAGALLGYTLARSRVDPAVRAFAERTSWCMVLLFVAPIALRLALMGHHPVPRAALPQEFSILLAADTLRRFRFSNPPHPFSAFFETLGVLQTPTYAAVQTLAQPLVLALFGYPWIGVLASVGAFCALVYWMLRAWVKAEWALAGGVLAVCGFGPLSQWANSYWGAAVTGVAGCLVFGAAGRLRVRESRQDAVLLGVGLGLLTLAHPWQAVFLLVAVGVLIRRVPGRLVVVPLICAAGILVMQNWAVTRDWRVSPVELSRRVHGVPAPLTIFPVEGRTGVLPYTDTDTEQQRREYLAQVAFHGVGTDSVGRYLARFGERVRLYRFFLLAPLYLMLPLFLMRVREWRFAWVLACVLVLMAGANLIPFFQFDDVAVAAPLFLLIAVAGLERICGWPARVVLLVCFAHFGFWFAIHLTDNETARRYETWITINHEGDTRRAEVLSQLSEAGGKHLVFVRYGPRHPFRDEWVYNAADIDGSPIVWARDLGAAENAKLRAQYSDRTAWYLEPDPPLNLWRWAEFEVPR